MAIPILHFFAFGYLGLVASAAARGETFDLPDWNDWRELFLSGLIFFLIFLGLAGGLFLVAFIVSLPLIWAGPLAVIPYMVAAVVAPPLTAAGWYRYARLGEWSEGFRLPDLFRLLQEAGLHLVLPTLAYVGFMFVGSPLFPLAFFVGGLVVFYFYCSIFCHVEDRRSGRSDVSFSVL